MPPGRNQGRKAAKPASANKTKFFGQFRTKECYLEDLRFRLLYIRTYFSTHQPSEEPKLKAGWHTGVGRWFQWEMPRGRHRRKKGRSVSMSDCASGGRETEGGQRDFKPAPVRKERTRDYGRIDKLDFYLYKAHFRTQAICKVVCDVCFYRSPYFILLEASKNVSYYR